MKILAFLALMLFMTGCSGPHHVSVAEFKKEYGMIGQPQSMHSVTYLGVRDGRVIIQASSMSVLSGKWKDRVIYVLIGELDPAFLRSLSPKPIQPPLPTSGLRPAAADL